MPGVPARPCPRCAASAAHVPNPARRLCGGMRVALSAGGLGEHPGGSMKSGFRAAAVAATLLALTAAGAGAEEAAATAGVSQEAFDKVVAASSDLRIGIDTVWVLVT